MLGWLPSVTSSRYKELNMILRRYCCAAVALGLISVDIGSLTVACCLAMANRGHPHSHSLVSSVQIQHECRYAYSDRVQLLHSQNHKYMHCTAVGSGQWVLVAVDLIPGLCTDICIHTVREVDYRTAVTQDKLPMLRAFWSSRTPCSPHFCTALKSRSSSASQGHVCMFSWRGDSERAIELYKVCQD